MSRKGNYFRTVAFGGFHKQDVLNYITTANLANQEQNTDLQQQAERALQENEQLAQKLETAEAARSKNADECKRLSELLAQRTTALERAEKELAELKEVYGKASERLSEVEQKLPELEEAAQAYEALKDYTATIELEAHRKAQETVEQARAQAAKLRSEVEDWLCRVQNTYQHLRTDLAATVTHLSGELERGQKALGEIDPALKRCDAALNELVESEGPKAPEPLPLNEQES